MTISNPPMAPIALGARYRDRITGFAGTATSRSEFLYGCVRVCLETGSHDGKDAKVEWFDEQRLESIDGQPIAATATSGGPQPTPPSRDPR